ncbi:hypothetical protein KIL84_003452 [Mauremys mutica]|uniref:Uncharacterized protein n=1 Tax=Mauremys mutica TaxID=74926 RepID=A0A9D4ARH1_9SAUR|nr:hypothetical protein KIL84_003452 [Mauremys mutica]
MHPLTVPFLWLILWKSNPVAHDMIKPTPAQIPAVKEGSASSSCYGQEECYKCFCLIFRCICSKPASKLRREHHAPWICICASDKLNDPDSNILLCIHQSNSSGLSLSLPQLRLPLLLPTDISNLAGAESLPRPLP